MCSMIALCLFGGASVFFVQEMLNLLETKSRTKDKFTSEALVLKLYLPVYLR
jgi:hypothetical protein